MIKQITLSALIALAGCPPIEETATPRTSEGDNPVACEAHLVQLTESDELPNCDLDGSQTWVWRIDETQADFDLCLNSGGTLMHDNEVPRWYCLDIDY